jgi:hypothetical protein
MFIVDLSSVLPVEVNASKNFICPCKVQASFLQGFVSFDFVEL